MASKEDFKKFVSSKPNLASYIKSGEMTWQKFYELYDIYGESSTIWDNYEHQKSVNDNERIKINEIFKNIDLDSVKEHINTAQKALSFVQELTGKSPNTPSASPVTPRPINKFFED